MGRRRSRLRGSYDRNGRRSYNGRSIGRAGAELDVLKPLARCQIGASRASASAAGGAGTTTADCGFGFEIVSRCRIEYEEQDEGMSKKRGSGTLPPPLSLARYSDRRPIPSLYVDGWSFGDTPITFTPAPRATSIA